AQSTGVEQSLVPCSGLGPVMLTLHAPRPGSGSYKVRATSLRWLLGLLNDLLRAEASKASLAARGRDKHARKWHARHARKPCLIRPSVWHRSSSLRSANFTYR